MQPDKITVTQVTLLIISLRLTVQFFTISTNTPPANQDVWIAQMVSMLYVCLFFLPLLYLSRRFPNTSLFQYSESIVGSILGRMIIISYLVFFVFLSVTSIVKFTIFIGSALIPETPPYLILLFLIIPSIFAVYKGIVVIARTGQIILPVVLGFIIIIIMMGADLFDFKVLLPVLKDSTLFQIHTGSYTFALIFHDALLLFLISPYMKEKRLEKPFFFALLCSTFLLIIINLAPLMALGIELAKHGNYPFYLFTRVIRVFDFIERIESLILAGWLLTKLFKLSVYIYFLANGFNQIIRTKSHQKYIIPFSILIVLISLYPKVYSIDLINRIISYQIFPIISIIFVFIIPLLLCIVCLFQKK